MLDHAQLGTDKLDLSARLRVLLRVYAAMLKWPSGKAPVGWFNPLLEEDRKATRRAAGKRGREKKNTSAKPRG